MSIKLTFRALAIRQSEVTEHSYLLCSTAQCFVIKPNHFASVALTSLSYRAFGAKALCSLTFLIKPL